MKQSMLTSAICFPTMNADAVDALLDKFRPELFGRGKIRNALRDKGIHFLSITVVRGSEGEPTHLVLEVSADGEPEDVYATLALGLDEWWPEILGTAGIVQPEHSQARSVRVGHVKAMLARTRLRTGQGLFQTAGLDFCGTPGMTVDRIRAEYKLADWLRKLPAESRLGESALDAVLRFRGLADAQPALALLRTPEAVAKLQMKSIVGLGAGSLLSLGSRAVLNFLWPVLLVLGLAVFALAILAVRTQVWAIALLSIGALVLAAGLILVAIVLWLYGLLKSAETANEPIDTAVNPAVMDAITASENLKDTQQNHLAGISVMQAGWVRELTLRLAFWVIAQMAAKHFRPGFLGDIGTIHYARWLRLPGTNKLLFFSNYGGSWESYLEDFITKASGGLTGAWSNTIGFPKTENLFFKGAVDGDRFKRWARRQQQPSRFWYSAYPHLTTARIRTNAAIRQGLWTVKTEEEARAWLGLFGSTVRPRDLIETADVQTLLYGGLSRHRFAACQALSLPEDPVSARKWLGTILPRITFGDEPPAEAVMVLSLTASGLRRLGLPEDVHNQFPAAFRAGMGSTGRANVLGDTGDDHASHWLWGGPSKPVDAVLLLYEIGRAHV